MLFVRKAFWRFLCLNRLVMYVFSLPVYLKLVHFCLIYCGWRSGILLVL